MHNAGALEGGALGDVGHAHAASLRLLWAATLREAQTQAFADAFVVIAACFAVAVVLVPLMRKMGAPAKPTADAH
jgi:DHA2 family multidrug resistance protein